VGLSLEVVRDIKAFFYEAAKINKLSIRQDPNQFLRLIFDFLARQETSGAATSPSFPSALPIHQSQFSMTIDAVTVAVNKFALDINNNLVQRPQLGSVAPKEVIRGGQREISGSFELDFENMTEYDKFIANTSGAIVAQWVGANIASTYYYTLKFTMPKVFYTPPSNPQIAGRGPVTIPFTFDAVEQTRGAQDELSCELTNTTTAVA
jgi:hypothetical protein